MGADIAESSSPRGWRVTCPTHGLNRHVLTAEHAANIARMHDRIDHADDTAVTADTADGAFNLTAAARTMLDLQHGAGKPAADAALAVWVSLTGVTAVAAGLALAEQYADRQTTAHTAPF